MSISEPTRAWCFLWTSCYILVFPTVYSKNETLRDGDMTNWYGGTSFSFQKSSDKNPGEEWVSYQDGKVLNTCGAGHEADFWFITRHVNLNTTLAEIIFVEIEAGHTLCYNANTGDVPCYSNDFAVYIFSGKYVLEGVNVTSYFKPFYNITINTSPTTTLIRTTQTSSFHSQNYSQGVTLGFRSRGACGKIFRIKMYYYYCEETFNKGIKFKRTSSPAEGSKNVTGNCSENSLPTNNVTSVNRYCYPNGTWARLGNDNIQCFCVEGYAPNKKDGSCSSCSNTSYKENISNDDCVECPTNTVSNVDNTSCVCRDGYYNSSGDNSEVSPCYALPVLSEKPSTRGIANGVIISWTAPKNSLNETVLYNVECLICNKQSICNISCMNEVYDPYPNNLTQTNVTVSNLTAGKNYVFRVFAINSLNSQVPKDQWNYSETFPVEFFSATTPSITTATPGSTDDENLILYIIIGLGALLLLILFILLIICVGRRKKNGAGKPANGYINEGVDLPALSQRLYVDPSNYDDPHEALRQLTNELDTGKLFLERLIGGGEFGDVYRGELTKSKEEKIAVAVKTLKHDADAKSAKDFLLEASVLGQFDNPNVVKMEGVVSQSTPHMIVLEYMSNGSLQSFLKSNDSMLTSLQLIGMARGVSAGMTYLSDMNFVHRDLAARNILVNDGLLCKIADFGLSRELETNDTSRAEYSTSGGKIPIRWTAPEAIKFRKFSSASDVWSFGILLWEIMSYAERPYWEWDNMKVLKQIEEGFRLPAPHNCPKGIHELMLECWKAERSERPSFAKTTMIIDKWIRSPETMKDEIDLSPWLGKWLESIKMSSYEIKFIKANYKNEDDLIKLTDEDLITIGITLIGHRNKIMKGIRSLKEKKKRESITI